jgi:hypothetical protein
MAFCKHMTDNKNVCELVLQPGGVHGHINNDMKLFDDAAKRTKTFLSKQQLGPSTPRTGTTTPSSKRGKAEDYPSQCQDSAGCRP